MIFQTLEEAIEAFEMEAVAPAFRDYEMPKDELGVLNGRAPFRIVKYDTGETHIRKCPDYQHDCWKEGCGTSWDTGGEKGVALIDARGVTLLDAGIVYKGGIGI